MTRKIPNFKPIKILPKVSDTDQTTVMAREIEDSRSFPGRVAVKTGDIAREYIIPVVKDAYSALKREAALLTAGLPKPTRTSIGIGLTTILLGLGITGWNTVKPVVTKSIDNMVTSTTKDQLEFKRKENGNVMYKNLEYGWEEFDVVVPEGMLYALSESTGIKIPKLVESMLYFETLKRNGISSSDASPLKPGRYGRFTPVNK